MKGLDRSSEQINKARGINAAAVCVYARAHTCLLCIYSCGHVLSVPQSMGCITGSSYLSPREFSRLQFLTDSGLMLRACSTQPRCLSRNALWLVPPEKANLVGAEQLGPEGVELRPSSGA